MTAPAKAIDLNRGWAGLLMFSHKSWTQCIPTLTFMIFGDEQSYLVWEFKTRQPTITYDLIVLYGFEVMNCLLLSHVASILFWDQWSIQSSSPVQFDSIFACYLITCKISYCTIDTNSIPISAMCIIQCYRPLNFMQTSQICAALPKSSCAAHIKNSSWRRANDGLWWSAYSDNNHSITG